MTDQTTPSIDHDALLAQAAAIYRDLRRAGTSREKSRRHTLNQMGEPFRGLVTPGPGAHLGPRWRNTLAAAERELTLPAPTPTNGHSLAQLTTPTPTAAPTAGPFTTAADCIRWLFNHWRDRAHPKPGAVFSFSPRQLADLFEAVTGRPVYPGSFTNEFLTSQAASSQAQRDGWRFEIANNDYEDYQVRVLAVPTPPPAAPPPAAYTEADVQRIAAEAVAEALRRLNNGKEQQRPLF